MAKDGRGRRRPRKCFRCRKPMRDAEYDVWGKPHCRECYEKFKEAGLV